MAKTEKLDLYKQHRDEYAAPRRKPVLVGVGPARYLAIAGRGAPGGEEFQAKVGAIYAAAFTIKMTRKMAGKGDYKLCHLEGLWWGRGGRFAQTPADQWCWKLLIRVPEFIKAGDLNKAVEALLAKGKSAEVAEVKLETIREGRCVQMLHVGPYDEEPKTIDVMRRFAEENGVALADASGEWCRLWRRGIP